MSDTYTEFSSAMPPSIEDEKYPPSLYTPVVTLGPAVPKPFKTPDALLPEPAEQPSPAAIKVQSADGITHEFPAGTLMSAVDKAMKTYAEDHRNKSTVTGQLKTGFEDPIEGGAQLLYNALPPSMVQSADTAWNALVDKYPSIGSKMPEGGMNERVKEREKAIDKERGGTTDLDWSRMAGNMLNPINYMGAGYFSGAGKLATIGNAAMAGAVGGAVSPASKDNFVREKAEQVGLGTALGGAIGVAGVGLSKGVESIGEYVARNYPDNITAHAVAAIMRRIHQDEKTTGVTATDAIDLINNAKKPLTLADVAGENTLALAGNVARQPGESRTIASQFLKQRDEGAAQRLSEDIGQHLFSGPTMHQASEVLLQARSAAGKPAYEAAHSLQNIWSPRLAEFLDSPEIKQGLAKGYEIERIVSLAEGRPITAKQMGVDIATDGTAKLEGPPNMRLLDMAKQGLDGMIAEERNAITGRLSQRGVALDQLRRAYVETIDGLDKTGIYKKARAEWAGYSQSLDAIKIGRAVFGASPEENAAAIAKMAKADPANLEFYRLGVADVLKERLAKTGIGGDEAKAIIRNPWMRDQLRPAFKDNASFEKFVEAVTAETQMHATKGAVAGNSLTAARTAEDAGGTGGGMLFGGAKLLRDIVHAKPLAAIKHGWQFYRDLGFKPNPEMNARIAQIIFSEHIPADTAKMLAAKTPPQLTNPAAPAAKQILFDTKILGAAGGVGMGETVDSMSSGKRFGTQSPSLEELARP